VSWHRAIGWLSGSQNGGIDEDAFAAAAVYQLLVDPAWWIHRRVESVDFVDDRVVRRRVSFDLTVPAELEGTPIDERTLPFVPLTLLRKGPLRNFDLDDADGVPIPVLTKAQNEIVVARSLEGLAESITGEPLSRSIKTRLRHVVAEAPPVAAMHLEGCRRVARRQTREGAVWRMLFKDQAFVDYIDALAPNFVLLAQAPPLPSVRRIVKLGYDEPFVDEPNVRDRLFRRLGWRATSFVFEAPAVSSCASYHFEVSVPADLVISSAELIVNGSVAVADETPGSRAHLYVADVAPGSPGTIAIDVQARRSGLVRASLFVAALAFVMLLGGYARLDEIANPTQTQTSEALLLLVPTLLAAYIVRPGEHQLASTLLLGVRLMVALAAASSIFASALLASGLATQHWWLITVLGSGACTLGVFFSYLKS
jgi:hypothetical protein